MARSQALTVFLAVIVGLPTFNWAECVAISVVVGDRTGDEWISAISPMTTSVLFALLFIAVPPSHAEGAYKMPLLAQLQKGGEARQDQEQEGDKHV